MILNDAVAVVSGGASGLGLATVQRLVGAGALVVVADLKISPDVSALGPRARFVEADITDPAAVSHALDVAEDQGPIRALVHTAGRGGDRLRILDRTGAAAPLESFRDVVRVNLEGTYNVLRLVAERMARNPVLDGERGACVLTASVAAYDGQVGQTAYAAAKAGVVGMTLVAARDLASSGVRVNTIAPGTFDTPMLARFPDEIRQQLSASVPYPKRLGSPDEYARMAVQLLENTYVNAETIRVDGGIRMAPR